VSVVGIPPMQCFAMNPQEGDLMKITSVGHAVSLFFVITFLICIVWGLVTPPSLHMHPAWQDLLPGFEFGTLTGILIGLVESYLYGWYVAILFVPLFNFFNRNSSAQK